MRILGIIFGFALGFGCSLDTYTCLDDGDCERGRQVGICQASGACSFPDASCLTGQRFGDRGPVDIAGVCVPPMSHADGVDDEDRGTGDGTAGEDTDGSDATGGAGGGNATDGDDAADTGAEPPTEPDPDLPSTDDLALRLQLDTSGATPLQDTSGHGLQVVCDGSCPVVGASGSQFGAGRGLRVVHDPRLDTNAGFTVTAWVQPGTAGSIAGRESLVMRLSSGAYPDLAMYLYDANGEGDNDLCAGHGGGSAWCEEDVMPDDAWYHLALRWDGTFLEFYVDGQMTMRDTPPGAVFGATDLWIGRAGPSTLQDFTGQLDDLRIYDVALDPAAIVAVLND